MILGNKQIAIDFGTSTTRIYVPKKGVVVTEPTLLALRSEKDFKSVTAVGAQAKEMQGKSSGAIKIIEPMRAGVIANYRGATALLSRFIQQSSGRFHLSKPEAMLTISATATSTEKRALIDAALDSGLVNVHLIQSSTAAALGAGLQIGEPKGVMIADIGAGSTEIGVYSLGGIVSESAVRIGGNRIDDAIRLMARREHGVLLGYEDVQLLKQRFLNLKTTENKSKTLTGQSSIHGTPKKVTIKQKQLQSYLELPLEQILQHFKMVLEQCPPDIISDIAQHGVVLSGGGAQIKGLSDYLSKKLHLACVVAENPELCAIKGAYSALSHLDEYKKSLLS